jgi:GNAT superfamily N-acetyltransferase
MITNFKRADEADIETLITLMQELYQEDGYEPLNVRRTHQTLVELVHTPDLGQIWLIQQHVEAIGYVALVFGYSLEYCGRAAEIDELYLRQGYRGQGIGSRTIKFIESICREMNIQLLALEVQPDNTHAQSFYQRLGFITEQRHLMRKCLT